MKTYVNFTRLQILLYYIASFVGLAPFHVRDNILRPVGFLRKAYAINLAILVSLFTYFAYFNVRARGIEVSSVNQFVFAMVLILFVGNFWVTLLVFVFKSNKMIDIMNQIIAIKDGLKTLGIEDNSEKNCKNFYAKIIATNSIVFLMKIIVASAHHDHDHDHGTIFSAIFGIGIIMISIHSHSAILIFAETMICIRKLFESLNHKLQGAEKPWNTGNIQLSVEDIRMIGKLHRELRGLADSATNFHTVPILFAIVRNFITLLSDWYSMYTHVFILHDAILLPHLSIGLVARTTVIILELLLIAHACTSMSRVGNATNAIVHEVWNKFYPEELRDELCKLSLQLLHRPVTVSAFGVLDLGYPHLYKIFCAFVAYFIIMIQFDTSQPNYGT